MATDFELAVFERQMQEVLSLTEAGRWTLERDQTVPLGLYVTMHPRTSLNERFKAHVVWRDMYAAPSVKFVDISTNAECNPAAWPRCFGFRPGSLDACLPWTAEGQSLHPEWQTSQANAYPRLEAPMEFILLNLQASLDHSYAGRGP